FRPDRLRAARDTVQRVAEESGIDVGDEIGNEVAALVAGVTGDARVLAGAPLDASVLPAAARRGRSRSVSGRLRLVEVEHIPRHHGCHVRAEADESPGRDALEDLQR